MDAKTTISISEARKRIFEIAEAVQEPDVHFTLTENGRPKAVMISAEAFESWQKRIFDEILARQGYVLADKNKRKYPASEMMQPLPSRKKKRRKI